MWERLKQLFVKVIPGIRMSRTSQKVKQALYAKVIRACTKCGAAGTDKYGRDIGDICPVCGAKRPKTEDLGRIWIKWFN